jgi:hypothetical protein
MYKSQNGSYGHFNNNEGATMTSVILTLHLMKCSIDKAKDQLHPVCTSDKTLTVKRKRVRSIKPAQIIVDGSMVIGCTFKVKKKTYFIQEPCRDAL